MNHRWTCTAARMGLVVTLSLLLGSCDASPGARLADGRNVHFEHWEDRWLIINYWAEWCAPCRKEIPELNRLHSERATTGAVVLGVNYDGITGESLTTLIEEMGIEFPVLVEDPRLRWGAEQPAVLPSTMIINPAGELETVLVGPQHYEDFLEVLNL